MNIVDSVLGVVRTSASTVTGNLRVLVVRTFWVCAMSCIGTNYAMAYKIEGYTDKRSYIAGEVLRLHVSTDSPSYSIEILKEGWVDSSILLLSNLGGTLRPKPVDGWLGADWPEERNLVVPSEWQTGSYVVKFMASDGAISYHPFAIRPRNPGSRSRVAFLMNYTTRLAYNTWGGSGIYQRAHNVSFLRPYNKESGRGQMANNQRLVHAWLEEEGFAPEYITEEDLHREPGLLDAYNVLVLAGHHEYISREVYDAIQNFHDRGAHLAFFSANDLWWQVRYEEGTNILVCYKMQDIHLDPVLGVRDDLLTTRWRNPPLDRPGEALQGVSFQNYSYDFKAASYVVRDAYHWAFEGTNLRNGQVLGVNLAGGESDFLEAASPPSLDVLLTARRDVPNSTSPPRILYAEAAATYYENSPSYGFPDGKGGQVFSSGTFTWGQHLQSGRADFEKVRRLSRNILNHMVNSDPGVGLPRATFTTTVQSDPLEVLFDASGSTDSDGFIVQYSWDFGDGSTDTGVIVTHTYASSGSYLVELTVTDDTGATAVFSKSVTVSLPNGIPTADAQSLTTPEDTAVAVVLTGSDPEGSPLSYALLTGPTKGTLSGTAPDLVYSPTLNFNGIDNFTFTVSDGQSTSDSATVSIEVTARNDSPTANAMGVSTEKDVEVEIVLTGTDVDGDLLEYLVTDGPSNGALTGTVPNLTYTPDAGYVGPDEFLFTVNDGQLTSNEATVSIAVTPGGPPVLVKLRSTVLAVGASPESKGKIVDESAATGAQNLGSYWAGKGGIDKAWFTIDLGAVYDLTKLMIAPRDDQNFLLSLRIGNSLVGNKVPGTGVPCQMPGGGSVQPTALRSCPVNGSNGRYITVQSDRDWLRIYAFEAYRIR